MIFLAYAIVFFLLLLCIALVITAAMHLWTGVPYVPTPSKVAEQMIKMAELKGTETVMDLGAGDGRVLTTAKRLYPGITAIGWEYVPTVWLIGKLHVLWSRQKVQLELGDAFKADASAADAIFLYLMPFMMRDMEAKFDKELKPGTVVVSRTFKFPTRPVLAEEMAQGIVGPSKLYLYRW